MVIVGLGNPGETYAGTPHNVGFRVADELAARAGCRLKLQRQFEARVGRGSLQGQAVLIVEPQTYMNVSGVAVAAVLRYYDATAADLLVVLDDADLPLGHLRLRAGGSGGGHKGLSSVVAHVGSTEFARLRIGIGRGTGDRDLVEHVLTPFSADERKVIDGSVLRAADAVEFRMEHGVDGAMNRFNTPRERNGDGTEPSAGGMP